MIDTIIRRGPNGNMIGFNAQVVQYFLNRNCCRRSAAPDTDNKTGSESAFEYLYPELKGIIQQFLGRQISFFVHNKSNPLKLLLYPIFLKFETFILHHSIRLSDFATP